MIPNLKSFRTSDALRERAHALIPGGCHTYAKGDDQYPVLSPGFIQRGSGARVWDVDGNEFVEYGMGNRAVGLGHGYRPVVEAAAQALAFGCNFTRASPYEVACAEAFLGMVPSAEMVKFGKNGSDATSAAVRLARAYTGRDRIAICADHPFFSVDDWFIGTTAMNAGVPGAVKALTSTFRYGDLGDVERLFAAHPGEIAALILEPARLEDPPEGYLQALKALAHANGALLILDEMITGFRLHAGGVHERYGVEPDLSCYGKALGNGFSISALAGKREIMRLGDIEQTERPRVFLLSTTHGAETHGLAAAIATMKVYRDEPVVETMEDYGRRLKAVLDQVIDRHGLGAQVKVLGKPSNMVYATADANGAASQAFRTLFLQEIIRRGVLAPSLVVSYAHDEDDLQRTVSAFDGALAIYARALSDGVERYLVGRPSQPVQRRFNGPAA
jgi:glutamate-1-semialdehyde 2,1-aminomutase